MDRDEAFDVARTQQDIIDATRLLGRVMRCAAAIFAIGAGTYRVSTRGNKYFVCRLEDA